MSASNTNTPARTLLVKVAHAIGHMEASTSDIEQALTHVRCYEGLPMDHHALKALDDARLANMRALLVLRETLRKLR